MTTAIDSKRARSTKTKLTIAALSGLLAGGLVACNSSSAPAQKDSTPASKSADSCSGKDGCAGKTATPKEGEAKASCSGKDGCQGKTASKKDGEAKASCSGKNSCS